MASGIPVSGLVPWAPEFFDLRPLPFAGWITHGLLPWRVPRRRDPADRARHGRDARVLRSAPLRDFAVVADALSAAAASSAAARACSRSGGSYSLRHRASTNGPGDYVLSAAPGWPGGRLLTNAQLDHPASWFRLHHIRLWVTYQPASRFGLFQVIEFGWLIVLAVILIAATVALIRRRAA